MKPKHVTAKESIPESSEMPVKFEFLFRVNLFGEDGDPPEVSTWYHAIDLAELPCRTDSDWIQESFSEEALSKRAALFQLDDGKQYQVIGKASLTVHGFTNMWGEYDEEIFIIEQNAQEIASRAGGVGCPQAEA